VYVREPDTSREKSPGVEVAPSVAAVDRLTCTQPRVSNSRFFTYLPCSYILDELLGVTCKVMTVSRGDELPNKARELAHHFSTQGTPIMIGEALHLAPT
jgi:hypothetical protein